MQNLDRLDRHCWEALVTPAPGDFHLIASPRPLEGADLRPEDVLRVLSLVQSYYRWMVLDLGRLNAVSASLVRGAEQILIVTTLTLAGLYQAKRAISALAALGAEADSLRVIINDAEAGEPLTAGELKTIFGLPVYARLPQDREELHRACLQRTWPDPESGIGRQLSQLVHALSGVSEGPAHERRPQFLSFFDRFRKSGAPAQAAN